MLFFNKPQYRHTFIERGIKFCTISHESQTLVIFLKFSISQMFNPQKRELTTVFEEVRDGREEKWQEIWEGERMNDIIWKKASLNYKYEAL